MEFDVNAFHINIDKFPKEIRNKLEDNTTRLSYSERNKFLRVLAQDVHEHTPSPGRRNLNKIGKKLLIFYRKLKCL